MELKNVRVQNFRSVEDSGNFSVDHLTCLVGKNEAGKTAILQAIAGINPHSATPMKYVLERDYPKRYLARYSERHDGKEAEVVSSVWEINDAEQDEIREEFGPNSITGNTVTVKRFYNSNSTRWSLPIDETASIEFLISQSNFSAPEKSQVGNPTSISDLISILGGLTESEKHKTLLDAVNAYPDQSILSKARAILEPKLPQFMYFSNYDRMNVNSPEFARHPRS